MNDNQAMEIAKQLKSMWHNASMLGLNLPVMDDDEQEEFDDFLELYRDAETHAIETEIEQKWGETLTLGFYGRSEATCYPSEWIDDGYYGISMREERAGLGGSGLEEYNRYRRVLTILRFIDAEVRKSVKNIPQAWRAWVKAEEGEQE